MGCSFSSSSSPTFKTIRVVHLNGYIEDFAYPVTAGEVIGKPARHLLCTRAQLASGGPKPMKPGSQLEPGNVYFLLPYSTIQSGVSPVDLATIAKKLTRVAKTKSPARDKSPARNSASGGSSPVWCSSPGRSPNRFSAQPIRVEPECSLAGYGSSKARSWKPILDTIREKSFHRKTESDLQEMHLETTKYVLA